MAKNETYGARILQAMTFDMEYDPLTLATITHIPKEDVSRTLKLMVQGG